MNMDYSRMERLNNLFLFKFGLFFFFCISNNKVKKGEQIEREINRKIKRK